MYKEIRSLNFKKSRTTPVLKDENEKILFSGESIVKRWHEYTTQLYSGTQVIAEADEAMNNIEVTKEEVKDIIARLPKDKATGIDDLPAEFLQCLGEKSLSA